MFCSMCDDGASGIYSVQLRKSPRKSTEMQTLMGLNTSGLSLVLEPSRLWGQHVCVQAQGQPVPGTRLCSLPGSMRPGRPAGVPHRQPGARGQETAAQLGKLKSRGSKW